MAKNANFVSHKKSKLKENGGPKLPLAADIVEGEIAINFGKDVETLSIKNESGDVVTFSCDNYYTEKKLGSGFTGANSANTVTSVIDNLDLGNEVEISSGETPTEETVELWVDTSVSPITVEVYTKAETDSLLLKKVNTYDVVQTIDSGTSASTSAVSTSAVYGFVTSYTPSITVDQVLDDTTSASTNPVSSKAVYDAVTDNELVWTNAYVTLSGAVSSHTENTEIHVTAADKEKLHTHSNKSVLDVITGNVGTMAYENASSYSSATEVNTALGNKANTSDLADFFDDAKYEDSGATKVINFYHGNTIKATIDASDFIVDGMVDDVRIENGNLVIDFNTASGKQDISIPLTDIFDPSNYYNKTAIDNLVGSGFTSSSITDVIIENEEIVSAALTDLDERKLDATAYTPTDLSNYYTKSETSGKTEISNALSGKSDTGHTHAIGDITNLQTALDGKANTATTLAGYSISDAYTKDETSGKTEISNALDAKVNTSDIISTITPSNSGSTAPIATKVVAENELTVSNALNDLNSNKADKAADLDNVKIKKITQSAYDALVQAGTVDSNTLYFIYD